MTTSSGSASPALKGWRAEQGNLQANCVRFGRLLREQGLSVSAERVVRWLQALDLLQCEHPADLFWSGRVTLVSSQAELRLYDDLFRQFWLVLDHAGLDPLQGNEAQAQHAAPRRAASISPPDGAPPGREGPGPEGEHTPGARPSRALPTGPDRRWQVGQPFQPPGAPQANEPDAEPVPGLYSAIEILREKDFSAFNREDEQWLRQFLLQRPLWLEPRMRSRRTRSDPAGDRIDMRRTVREAVRWGGDPVRLLYRKPARRWRKWVFLCDISASMAPYTRALLLFTQTVAARRRATEIFLFGTRLTRITAQLQRREAGSMDGMLHTVRDYHGGTRLGEALEQFLRQYGRRGMAHGANLFILSDGLDHGEAGRVGAAMERFGRLAHRIIWVNPLKQSRGYAPEAQAMREALPHIDEFVSGHNLQTLTELLTRAAQDG